MYLSAIAAYLVARMRIDDERGASLVEYAFLVALIAVVCIAALLFLGEGTSKRFSTVGSSVGNAGG